jgi:hypothetical protein
LLGKRECFGDLTVPDVFDHPLLLKVKEKIGVLVQDL